MPSVNWRRNSGNCDCTVGARNATTPPSTATAPRMTVSAASARGQRCFIRNTAGGASTVETIRANKIGRTPAQIFPRIIALTYSAAAVMRKRRHQPANHRAPSPMTSARSMDSESFSLTSSSRFSASSGKSGCVAADLWASEGIDRDCSIRRGSDPIT